MKMAPLFFDALSNISGKPKYLKKKPPEQGGQLRGVGVYIGLTIQQGGS
jgi:hypothetical protein